MAYKRRTRTAKKMTTIGMVREAIKQLKHNMSAGKDVIGAELIKMSPSKLAKLPTSTDRQDLGNSTTAA